MITVRNQKLIKRGTTIGRYATILAVVVLGGGMYLSIREPDQVLYTFAALIVGFTFSQVGVYYSSRFSNSPRSDEHLDAALKGLDDSYTLYHYQSPVSHLLIGPSGLWILLPYTMKGKIVYNEDKKRWRNLGAGPISRLTGRDTIGRPDQDVARGLKQLQKEFSKIPEFEVPEIKSALVFSSENAVVEAVNAPIHTLHARQLKKLIRKEAKGDLSLNIAVVKTIQDHLGVVSNE